MTQIERIRAMSTRELAEWLLNYVEDQNFSVDACEARFCPTLASTPIGENCDCSNEKCIAAAVRYLESEVQEK